MIPEKKKKVRYEVPVDYLLKKRQMREKIEETEDRTYHQHDWDKIAKDMSPQEKAQFLVEQSKKLELDVEQKETMLRNVGQTTSDKKTAKVCNDMLFDAIQAKLEVLNSLN